MAPPSLLGPPELHNPTTTQQRHQNPVAAADPFMDLLVANFNNAHLHPNPHPSLVYTENMSPTYLASGNPCLDFFFHVVPDTPPDSIRRRLLSSWSHNALTTLKLIFNLRGVRGTGKSDKEGFYTAAFWLHQHHPKTLACNIPSLSDFGYIKDMPEILFRLLEGADVRKKLKEEWNLRKMGPKKKHDAGTRWLQQGPFQRHSNTKKTRHHGNAPEEIRKLNAVQRASMEKENASMARNDKRIAMAKKVIQRYNHDPDFRFLYERVSDFFAETLKADLEHLKAGKINKVSLAAKWCPSIDSSFDRSTLLCESIAKKIFPREEYEYEGVEEAHYAYRVRDRLRQEVLVPLRKVLELPEVYIGASQWDSIPYNRVASVAMSFYKDKFLKHDGERFSQYLADVKAGKAKIAAGALLPHEIISALYRDCSDGGGEVAELQWKRMVGDLLKKGNLKNCLAISDVSGSMHGTPMEVSVALGLLVSEMSQEPWKGKVITFSENPQLQMVKGGDSLREKTEFVRGMEWGMNTDFQKVFDVILKVAVDGKLGEDQMIKRVFVFSDMEFDQASSNPWETDYQVIVRKFSEKGFGKVIPEIVFWNLRDSRATPVPATQKGVALVSGFSKNLMKLFLDGDDGDINPEAVMENAISGEEYQKLALLD